MGEFFKGWRRKAGCVLLFVASSIVVLFVVARVRTALEFRDHSVIGPLFIVANILIIASPIIGGVVAAQISQRTGADQYGLVPAGVILGLGISAICFRFAKYLVFEYLA
ncbi:MAG: hypothetical protein AABP62_20965 [Planctomycetota bacterium]